MTERDMSNKEFEELKALLVKYRNEIKEKYPEDKEGICDIERIIRCVNIELSNFTK